MITKDKPGLYFKGDFKTNSYSDAIKEIYQLDVIPNGFCVNSDHEANHYSIVDNNGVQHIYDLSPVKFYDELMKLD